MLRVFADVNGHRIGGLFIHNTGRHRDNVWEYDAATWDQSRMDGVFGIEGVRHKRDDTWFALVARVTMAGGL